MIVEMTMNLDLVVKQTLTMSTYVHVHRMYPTYIQTYPSEVVISRASLDTFPLSETTLVFPLGLGPVQGVLEITCQSHSTVDKTECTDTAFGVKKNLFFLTNCTQHLSVHSGELSGRLVSSRNFIGGSHQSSDSSFFSSSTSSHPICEVSPSWRENIPCSQNLP